MTAELLKARAGTAESSLCEIRGLRGETPDGGDKGIVVIGHSASGKSTAARILGLDRKICDLDVFMLGKKADAPTMLPEFLRSGGKILIVSNSKPVLEKLRNEKKSLLANLAVVYLRRPKDLIRETLTYVNEDDRKHLPVRDLEAYYADFDRIYMSIADYVLDYSGRSLEELASIIGGLAEEVVKMAPYEVIDAVGGADRFDEYLKVRSDVERGDSPSKLLDPAEMKRLTAGGYQVFDASVFPPVPLPGSIAEKKLQDLRWGRSDFAGKTVAEIGSQLGFFAFIAASLGARQVVGTDVNPKFVAEANRFAVHYKRLCGWDIDKVMFRTQKIGVGSPIAGAVDIIVASSIVHWFIIQDKNVDIEDVLIWLRDSCDHGLYFEGCVTALEKIMQDHGVSLERYNEERFLNACEKIFNRHEVVGRCSYNKLRLVVRLYK